jgi:ABC-type enterochelin transport system substrate-binding protein
MRSTIARPLAEFLTQPNIEASPAGEFINDSATIELGSPDRLIVIDRGNVIHMATFY